MKTHLTTDLALLVISANSLHRRELDGLSKHT
jgi:hypothetical protein